MIWSSLHALLHINKLYTTDASEGILSANVRQHRLFPGSQHWCVDAEQHWNGGKFSSLTWHLTKPLKICWNLVGPLGLPCLVCWHPTGLIFNIAWYGFVSSGASLLCHLRAYRLPKQLRIKRKMVNSDNYNIRNYYKNHEVGKYVWNRSLLQAHTRSPLGHPFTALTISQQW